MFTTRLSQQIEADRSSVYGAIISAEAVSQWMVPDGMRSEIHHFDAREGGEFRVSLTYDEPEHTGKTSAHTDTYHGRFVELVHDERVIQAIEFESADPSMLGEMIVRFTLTDSPGGTLLVAEHANVPFGIRPEDNELGWRLSLEKLARLVEEAAGSA